MRKPETSQEVLASAEATTELSKDNLQTIEQWLDYLHTLATEKKGNAGPMQKDLLQKYETSWSKFFEVPDQAGDAAKLSQEQMMEIKQAMVGWHQKETDAKQKVQQQIFGERIHIGSMGRILEKTGLFNEEERNLIIGFYFHDSRHVSTDLHFTDLLTGNAKYTDEKEQRYIIDKQSQEHFMQQIQNFAVSANMSAYPEEWLYQLISQRTSERLSGHGLKDRSGLEEKLKSSKITTDPLKEVALPVALALQRRFVMQGYEILINPQSNEVQANTVIIKTHLQSEKIPVNPAILTSLIYNLTKNAGKAIQAYKSRNPGDTKVCKIEIEINEDEKGWNFVVADTGIGLETDALLQQAGTAVRHAAPHELEIYKNISGKRAIKILQDWTSKDKSLQARDLKLGQVWDFAKLPRLSGFDKDGIRESSGFGLYGADHLAKNYGGDIVGANRFGQGAVFVIRIPKSEKLEALAA